MPSVKHKTVEGVASGITKIFGKVNLSGTNAAGFASLSVTGSGFQGCYISGTTYTVVLSNAWPQVVGVDGALLLSTNYGTTSTGSLMVSFNNGQLNQLTASNTVAPQPTGSGNPQTIDFQIKYPSGVVAPVTPAGSGSVFLEFTFLNQNYIVG